MYEEKPKGFIEELQSLNDVTKKRVLVISTVIIMMIVVGLWLSYFNGILAAASQPTVAEATSSAVGSGANGPSMWQNIKNEMASMGNVFNSSSQYNVQPASSSQ